MEVFKDFLNKEEFKQLSNNINSINFDWYFTADAIQYKQDSPNLYNFQFFHYFYFEHKPRSSFPIVKNLIDKLNPRSIIRIKANLQTSAHKIIEQGMHTDLIDTKNLKTAVYYLNTNNGYTRLEDEKKIYSEQNKIVIFDAGIKHTGTTCTDKQTRVVININYLP